MADGPGKYDAETTMVRERTGASAVVLVVVGGDRGHGFSMQMERTGEEAALCVQAAATLRGVADQLDSDAMRLAGTGARARARLLLEAAKTSLAMLAYGLGAVTATLGPEFQSATMAAANLMTDASAQIERALKASRPSTSTSR